jgi:hypothetical protein
MFSSIVFCSATAKDLNVLMMLLKDENKTNIVRRVDNLLEEGSFIATTVFPQFFIMANLLIYYCYHSLRYFIVSSGNP